MMSSRFSVKKRARQSRVVRAAVTVVPCLCGWLNAGLRPRLAEAGLERWRRGDEKRADQEQEQKKDPGAQSEHPRRSELFRRRLT